MEEYCKICGARLINSPDGIGCGCRAMLEKCTYLHMKNNTDKTYYYKFWNVEANLYMKAFKDFVSNVNFKSSFRKDFSASVIAFYDKKGYVSKKQLYTVKSIMANDYRNELVEKATEKEKKEIKEEYKKLNYNEIVEMTHKMWEKENN